MANCFHCGEPIEQGEYAFRIGTGEVEYSKRGPLFENDLFPDGEYYKWGHPGCFPDALHVHLAFGQCVICGHSFDPSECVLFVEYGEVNEDLAGNLMFIGRDGGFVHFTCADELGFDVWRLQAW